MKLVFRGERPLKKFSNFSLVLTLPPEAPRVAHLLLAHRARQRSVGFFMLSLGSPQMLLFLGWFNPVIRYTQKLESK